MNKRTFKVGDIVVVKQDVPDEQGDENQFLPKGTNETITRNYFDGIVDFTFENIKGEKETCQVFPSDVRLKKRNTTMKKKQKYIYTVHAVRFSETHSYVVGVFSSKTKAIDAAIQEEIDRGGNKYKCSVQEFEIDKNYEYDYKKNETLMGKEIDFDHVFKDGWMKLP